ncbi:protein spire isoform X2 [Chrysoperla carnea]|uniref:protein spire isoform X2 n=1 Tax=Chrysoperla carnea TaxID=189513 RepID=UPI001D06FFF8|nr:protein spire isoform X2 [Chrysoperla carnea]
MPIKQENNNTKESMVIRSAFGDNNFNSGSDHVLSLNDVLTSFNGPISVEFAWALCYQCAKCFNYALSENRSKCLLVSDVEHVFIQSDGNISLMSIYGDELKKYDSTRTPLKSERELVRGLGCVIYNALDFKNDTSAEVELGPQLEELITYMTSNDDDEEKENEVDELERLDGTDDEGIERDSGDYDCENAGPSSYSSDILLSSSHHHHSHHHHHHHRTLAKVQKLCVEHIGPDAEKHYRKVVSALYAEARELATFLQTVSSTGARDFRPNPDISSCSDLDKLQTMDWSRFWVQVIGELRMGVKLKKVDYSRTPIEYELTPYEILMDDIRSRRYKLRKVMIDGDVPPRVKKDAHAVILEFIRKRPPLRKVSDRKLPPLVRCLTPHEKLLDSIKKGKKLRPSIQQKQSVLADTTPPDSPKYRDESDNNSTQINSQPPKRRLIKVDFSAINLDDDDDEDLDSPTTTTDTCDHGFLDSSYVYPKSQQSSTTNNTPQRTVTQQSSTTNPWKRTAYDLATQCPSRRASMRRHTVVACAPELPVSIQHQSSAYSSSHYQHHHNNCYSVPQSQPGSRPGSRLSHTSNDTTDSNHLGTTLPEMSWSRSSLQDELMQSKQWQEAMSLDDRLSLTLEEIVHIRSVLTKAELEGLPVEGHVKEDVEKRKVCFLCLKTRFGIFGPWGQRCKLCKRTVCAKCHSKMRIPTEHFSNVPVVLLSPTLMSSPEDDNHKDTFPRSLMARLMIPDQQQQQQQQPSLQNQRNNIVRNNSVGSAPSSPNFQRAANGVGVNNGIESSNSAPGSRVESRMATSMEGPTSLPAESPASTISERRSRMARAKTQLNRFDDKSSTADKLKGMQMIVCHDCKTMVIQIIKSSRTNRTAIRNNALRNLTLNLSPVY